FLNPSAKRRPRLTPRLLGRPSAAPHARSDCRVLVKSDFIPAKNRCHAPAPNNRSTAGIRRVSRNLRPENGHAEKSSAPSDLAGLCCAYRFAAGNGGARDGAGHGAKPGG